VEAVKFAFRIRQLFFHACRRSLRISFARRREFPFIVSARSNPSITCACAHDGSGELFAIDALTFWCHFDDGGFAIYSGNYFFGSPGHGAFVLGFKAFRWLLGQLGVKQPRRFKNESTVIIGSCVQDETDKASGTKGIDNFALHKLLDKYIANKEKNNPS
jgi:hypothetical protein